MSNEWKKIPAESLQILNSYMSEYYIPNIYPSSISTINITKDNIYTYTLLSEFGFLLIANKQSVNYSGIVYFNNNTCSALMCGNKLYIVSTIPSTSENEGVYIAHDTNNTVKIWNNTDATQTIIINSTIVKLDN